MSLAASLLALGIALVVIGVGIIVWTFWLFPNLLIVLEGFHWVNATPVFQNALYWLGIGIVIFGIGKSVKIS